MQTEDEAIANVDYSFTGIGLQNGYDYEFISPLSTKYECAICLVVIRNPMQTTCGHRFCRDCIIGWLDGSNKECPIDKQPLSKNDLFYDSCIERDILQLKVKCPNNALGCSYHVDLKYIEDHMKACNYQPVVCPNECSMAVLQNELEEHITQHCLSRFVKCRFCHSPYIFQQEQVHMVDCPQVGVSCELCGSTVTRDKIAEHIKDVCLQAEISCSLAEHGCHYKSTRTKMKLHLNSAVDHHIQLLSTAYKKMNALLLDLYRNVGHVGSFSRQPSLRSQMSSSSNYDNHGIHTDNFTYGAIGGPYSLMPVPFSLNSTFDEKQELNLNEEAKQLQNSALEEAKHLQNSALSFGSTKEDTLKEGENELRVSKSCSDVPHNGNQQRLLRDLGNRSVDIEQRILENSIKLENALKRIDVMENDLKFVAREFNGRFNNGTFVWRIPNFLQNCRIMETDGKVLHSIPFYSSPFGYKFCLRTNITNNSNQSYLAMYIHMMKSENDYFLNWPFQGKVLLQLLDCGDHKKKKHFTETMDVCTEMEAFKRPKNVRNEKGYGFKDFLSLDQIINANEGCIYLKNDALYIKAVVTENKNEETNNN